MSSNGKSPMAALQERMQLSEEAHQLELRDLKGDLGNAYDNLEIVTEALAELELALEDTGWQRLSGFGDREFSVTGLRKLRRLARLSYLKNPLIRRAVNVKGHYVWGQGCTMSAPHSDDVNDVIQDFLDDPKNSVVFSGHQARLNLDAELQVDGELFLPLFTNADNGRVIVRRINPDEIYIIISNPDDYMEPWFYKRSWTQETFDPRTGSVSTRPRSCYYPDWRLVYNMDPDIEKPDQIGSDPVVWDAPIYHLKVGGFGDQKRGCPEVYSALDWARAVKDDLEDYATIRRAHSRFAFKATTKGGKAGVAAVKSKLNTTMNQGGTGQGETNPPPVTGSVWTSAEGWELNPFKTAGMVPSPEEGRRLWLMVGAGVDLPETILAGNADVGNLATAKTLDRPTELAMENRRTLWIDTYVDILNYVIDQAIKAPNGSLEGNEVVDDVSYLVSYELADAEDAPQSREIDIRFPSILRHEILPLVQATIQAATLNGKPSAGVIDDRTLSQLLLTALGENDYDDVVAAMFPEGTLTFNAGRFNGALLSAANGAMAGDGNGPDDQGNKQSASDTGLPPMGGAPPFPQQSISFEPYLSKDLAVVAALREAKRGRSGLTVDIRDYRKRLENQKPAAAGTPSADEPPGFP